MISTFAKREKRRLPVPRVKMTACLGFRKHDGIVLCADSREADGYVKRTVDKVRVFGSPPDWEVAVALAGSGHLWDSFWGRVKDELASGGLPDENGIKEKIERALKPEVERCRETDETFRLLIAMQGVMFDPALFLQTEAILSPVDFRVHIGLAPEMCEYLLGMLDERSASVHEAERLAVFIMSVLADCTDDHIARPIHVVKYVNESGTFEFGDAAAIEKEIRPKMDVALKKVWERFGKGKK
jgi:hypothetical protein